MLTELLECSALAANSGMTMYSLQVKTMAIETGFDSAVEV
jgi:hypothetical protein